MKISKLYEWDRLMDTDFETITEEVEKLTSLDFFLF